MSSQKIIEMIEAELRPRWRTWNFKSWIENDAEKIIIDIYSKLDTNINATFQAKNLYYAMESYLYFADLDKCEVRDLLVFLERILANQRTC
jgi:hypothetical protein